MRNDVGNVLWAAFTVRRLLALPHCCMDWRTGQLQWWIQLDRNVRLRLWLRLGLGSRAQTDSHAYFMLRLNTDELLPRLTKSFASIKIVSATHARTVHGARATGQCRVLAIRFMCVLTAKLALLIFLRCQFMVIFYVPNIKTQKATLHFPLPLSQHFALCHRIPTQSNSIRVSQVKSSFVLGYSALHVRPSVHTIQLRFWPQLSALSFRPVCVGFVSSCSTEFGVASCKRVRHVESAQCARSPKISWESSAKNQRVTLALWF